MKKIVMILILGLLLTLAGCKASEITSTTNSASTTTLDSFSNESNETTLTLNDNESFIFSTYLSSGLLSSLTSDSTMNNRLNDDIFSAQYLSNTTTTATNSGLNVEPELDNVNIYFDKLKSFMDNGADSVLSIQEEPSTNSNYEQQVTYTLEGITYIVYYTLTNVSGQDMADTTTDTVTTTESSETTTDTKDNFSQYFQLEGLMIIDGVEYNLTGFSTVGDNGGQNMWFETEDSNHTSNHVKVTIKDEAGNQKFSINSMIDGVEKSSDLKFVQEGGNTNILLNLYDGNETSFYHFKKINEDNKTIYMLNYIVGGINGRIQIFVSIDENGNPIYTYHINEGNKSKVIEKHHHVKNEGTDDGSL